MLSGSGLLASRWLTQVRRDHSIESHANRATHAVAIPVWMTDQAVCGTFSKGPPVVSLSALGVLRIFFDALQSTINCDKSSGNISSLECPDEATKKDQGSTSRAVLQPAVNQATNTTWYFQHAAKNAGFHVDGTAGNAGIKALSGSPKRLRP